MNHPSKVPALALAVALSLGGLGACHGPSPSASPTSPTGPGAAAPGRDAVKPAIRCIGKSSCDVSRVTDDVKAQLEAMTPLPSIVFSPASPEDLATIARLPSIKKLTVAGARVTSLEPLAGLAQLESLTLGGVSVRSLAPLGRLPALQELEITAPYDLSEGEPGDRTDPNEIRYLDTGLDLASVGSLPSLRSLKLKGVKVPGALASLAAFPGLRELELKNTRLEREASLEAVPQLESFACFKVPLGSLDFLARAPRLTRVSLNTAGLKDITPLGSIKTLKELSLFLNPDVVSIKPLAALASLEKLEVNRTSVDDVAPLAGLKSLKSLDVSHTRVRSLDPLARLPGLSRLSFVDTPVRDMKALKALRTLTLVDVPDEMPKEQVEALRAAIPGLKIRLSSGVPAGG